MPYSPHRPPRLPDINTRESIHLEFKRSDSLRDAKARRQLAREVVALRNAEGGEIWVGAEERDEHLVGWAPFTNAESGLRDRLRDLLVDAVEPPLPLGREIHLDAIDISMGWVLCIQVHPRRTGEPHACFRDGNKREFLRRTDARTELIPYGELFQQEATSTPPTDLRTQTRNRHEVWHVDRNGAQAGLALTIHHEDSPRENEDLVLPRMRRWLEILRSPAPELARKNGWTWYAGRFSATSPRLKQGDSAGKGWLLESGSRDEPTYRHLVADEAGNLQFFTAAAHLRGMGAWSHSATRSVRGEAPQDVIDSRILVESVASLVRLASAFLRDLNVDEQSAGASAAIVSLDNLVGAAFPRGPIGEGLAPPPYPEDWVTIEESSLHSTVRLVPSIALADSPDALSHRLLQDLYEAGDPERPFWHGDIPWFQDERTFAPPF